MATVPSSQRARPFKVSSCLTASHSLCQHNRIGLHLRLRRTPSNVDPSCNSFPGAGIAKSARLLGDPGVQGASVAAFGRGWAGQILASSNKVTPNSGYCWAYTVTAHPGTFPIATRKLIRNPELEPIQNGL